MGKKKLQTKKHSLTNNDLAAAPVSFAVKVSFFNRFWLQSFLLALVCFVFYANTFNNGYAVDDFLVIDKNEAVSKGLAGIPQLFTSDVFDSYYKRYNANNRLGGGRYRPLALITYAIEQQIFGQTIQASENYNLDDDSTLTLVRHVNNVLLYILSIIALLYFFRKVVFPKQHLLAFLSVLLFAIHPIHTEVVANIKSRDEILSLLFISLSLIKCYDFKETAKISTLFLSLLFFFLALLSKEYAVSLIVLIPLMFYLFKNVSLLNALKTVWPFILVLVLYFIMRYSFVPFKSVGQEDDILNNPYLLASYTQKIATEISTLLQYLKLLLFPHPLSADYSYNQIPYKKITDFIFWLSFFIHVFLIGMMVFFTKKRNVLAFAIAIYLVPLLLVSNILFSIGATMGERLIYHSSLGFCIVIAYIIYEGYNKMKPDNKLRAGLVIFLLLLVVLSGIKTITRNKDWESNSTLYRKDVLTSGNSAVVNANAGNAYLQLAPLQNDAITKKAMLDTAITYLNKAIAIHPLFTLAYINRGNVFFQSGDLEHAKQDWDKAKSQYPTHPSLPGLYASYYINTAVIKYGSKGNYEAAISELDKGAAIAPQNIILLFNLGYYYNLVGKKDSAIIAFQKIIKINPNDTLAIKCRSYIDILKKAKN